MEPSKDMIEAAYRECEAENIQRPNAIQSFGFLLALDKDSLDIVQCSSNVADFLQCQPAQLLGTPLVKVIDPEAYAKIIKCLKQPGAPFVNPFKSRFLQLPAKFNAVVHLVGRVLIMEVEPAIGEDFGYADFYNNISHIIDRFTKQKDIRQLSQVVAQQLKLLTGYDRVMVYQFAPDWSGSVVAESREEQAYAFLGHHFPASDIPVQARQLYLHNKVRIIPDCYENKFADLVPAINPLTNEALDLSGAFLRSVSPIHIEYLQNMKVSATLTASVIREDQLWGMISFHHYSPKFIDYRLRTVVEHVAKLFAYHLHLLADMDDHEYLIAAKSRETTILKQFIRDDDFFATVANDSAMLLNLNSATGVAVFYENNFCRAGTTPDRPFLNKLVNWLYVHQTDKVFHTACLSSLFPEASGHTATASGLLAIRLANNSKNFILWFKSEIVYTVTWGGNPAAKLSQTEHGFRLSPRKSFEKWENEVRNCSTPWKKSEISIAKGFYKNILELLVGHTERLQYQKLALEVQVQERTLDLRSIHEELNTSNEELRAINDQMLDSLNIITELNLNLQTAQLKLKAVFDSTRSIHFLLDKNYQVLFFNKAALQAENWYHKAGLNEGDNLINMMGEDEKSKAGFKKCFQRAFAGENFEIEEHITFASGKQVWCKTEFYQVVENKSIIGVALNITNIDEIKKSEQQVMAQNEALKKIAFIQSHEVRRPVATILGLINLIDKENMNEPFNAIVIDKLEVTVKELDEVIHRTVKATYLLEEEDERKLGERQAGQ